MEIKPIIEVENLCAQFDDSTVLKDICFTAFPNEISVILGSSGSGKTTVMKHLIGLYSIQQGRVRVMDFRLNDLDEKGFHRFSLQMGVLFQNGALLNSLCIGENVAIPLEQHTNLPKAMIEDLVRTKLSLVELGHAARLFPAQLSGGMRKRAALARAIALDPPILFCDEPSAGLDPVTLAGLDELFLKLRKQLGITIILITHEVSSIFRLADRIVFLENGVVAYEGNLEAALRCGIPSVELFFKKARGRGEA